MNPHHILRQAALLLLGRIHFRGEMRQVGLRHVAGKEHRLGSQQEKAFGDFVLLVRERERDGRLARHPGAG